MSDKNSHELPPPLPPLEEVLKLLREGNRRLEPSDIERNTSLPSSLPRQEYCSDSEKTEQPKITYHDGRTMDDMIKENPWPALIIGGIGLLVFMGKCSEYG